MILVLNLKMNLSKENIESFERKIHDKKVIVLPQYPYLTFFNKGNYELGSQDLSKFSKGSYTGEVCAKGLKQLGVNYSLIGHSERRKYFNETLDDIKMKLNNATDNAIIPIYCIVLKEQDYIQNNYDAIDEQLSIIDNNIEKIIIALEPDWLIGKPNIEINIEKITNYFSYIAEKMRIKKIDYQIIYGGGVDENSVNNLLKIKYNSGFIVSSSILVPEKLELIYSIIENNSNK